MFADTLPGLGLLSATEAGVLSDEQDDWVWGPSEKSPVTTDAALERSQTHCRLPVILLGWLRACQQPGIPQSYCLLLLHTSVPSQREHLKSPIWSLRMPVSLTTVHFHSAFRVC